MVFITLSHSLLSVFAHVQYYVVGINIFSPPVFLESTGKSVLGICQQQGQGLQGSHRARGSRASFGTETGSRALMPSAQAHHDLLLPFLQHPFPSLRLLIPAHARGTHPFVQMKGVSITQRSEI